MAGIKELVYSHQPDPNTGFEPQTDPVDTNDPYAGPLISLYILDQEYFQSNTEASAKLDTAIVIPKVKLHNLSVVGSGNDGTVVDDFQTHRFSQDHLRKIIPGQQAASDTFDEQRSPRSEYFMEANGNVFLFHHTTNQEGAGKDPDRLKDNPIIRRRLKRRQLAEQPGLKDTHIHEKKILRSRMR